MRVGGSISWGWCCVLQSNDIKAATLAIQRCSALIWKGCGTSQDGIVHTAGAGHGVDRTTTDPQPRPNRLPAAFGTIDSYLPDRASD